MKNIKMARKYVRGYTIEDIKVGMKIKDKGDKKTYGIVKNIKDVHSVVIYIYDAVTNKRIGNGFYCFDKTCEFDYDGGKIEIIE